MPAADLSSFKVAVGDQPTSAKLDALVDAIQAEFGDIDPDQLSGFPNDASKYLAGDGSWKPLPQKLIGDIDLTAAQQFAAIPQTYRTLRLIVFGRVTSAVVTDAINMRFNGDAGANYDNSNLQGNNGVASAGQTTGGTSGRLGSVAGNTATANRMGIIECLLPGYAGTTFQKLAQSVSHSLSTSAAANMGSQLLGALWLNTAAITQINLLIAGGGAWAAGSRAYLYGVNH